MQEAINEKSMQNFYRRPKNLTAYKEKIKQLRTIKKEKIWLREWAVAFIAEK